MPTNLPEVFWVSWVTTGLRKMKGISRKGKCLVNFKAGGVGKLLMNLK